MLKELKRDSERYAKLGGWYANLGFWIGAIYRYGMWAHALPTVVLRLPAWALYRLVRASVRIVFNVDFWAGSGGANIGPGLCLIHPADVIIARGVNIGEDC